MKKKYNKIYLIIMINLCIIGVLYSTYKIIYWKDSNNENNKIIEDINKDIEVNTNEEDNSKYNINFDNLKKKNSDTVAYLKVNNTKIDYVVVKGKNNEYYLTHNFNKKANAGGWVFADYNNRFDGSDKNIVIYGHNMKNGSMFGTLYKVLNKKWYRNKDNHKIVFVTEEGEYTYQVFSVYSIKAEDYYINTKFKDDNEFKTFVKKLKKRSKYDFKVSVDENDKILTLSTCNTGGRNRTVLHAKMIEN